MYKEIEGDLISLALAGSFDVIAHGVNCFCTQGAGIAAQMVKVFDTHTFPLEQKQRYVIDKRGEERFEETKNEGNINKLGQIDYRTFYIKEDETRKGGYYKNWAIPLHIDREDYRQLTVVNAYTQYRYGRNHSDGDYAPVDYEAIRLCFRKMNHVFKGKRIGIPAIGTGLAGGDLNTLRHIIGGEFRDVDLTLILYNK